MYAALQFDVYGFNNFDPTLPILTVTKKEYWMLRSILSAASEMFYKQNYQSVIGLFEL